MLCASCGNPCRGRCIKCKQPLCYKCSPKKPRAKCPSCPRTSRNAQTSSSSTPVITFSPAITSQGTPYYVPPASSPYGTPASHQLPVKSPVDIEQLSPQELINFVDELREALILKQIREQNYLDRRAGRPGHKDTPTDIAYRADQPLEDNLIRLLYYIKKMAEQELGI